MLSYQMDDSKALVGATLYKGATLIVITIPFEDGDEDFYVADLSQYEERKIAYIYFNVKDLSNPDILFYPEKCTVEISPRYQISFWRE